MPKITINEVDNTLRSFDAEVLENVVYIPGFATQGPVQVPTICRTASDFVSIFGEQPVFTQDQIYTAAFGPTLSGQVMFKIGDLEPSYFMAKELLTDGIPVIYDRVNTDASATTTLVQDTDFDGGSELPAPTTADLLDYYVVVSTTSDPSNPYSYRLYNLIGTTTKSWVELSSFVIPESATLDENNIPDEIVISNITVSDLYTYLSTRFDLTISNVLLDKNLYNIQFVTAGGYPTFEYSGNSIATAMRDFAANRGDCIAVIDHTNRTDRALVGTGSVFEAWQGSIFTDQCAMFTPYTEFGTQVMPASFAYFKALANSVKTNPNWLAVAGTVRGVVPDMTGLHIGSNVLTMAMANSYMEDGSRCINPVVSMNPYGFIVWGNRTATKTAENTEKALYFLNMRMMVSAIKKQCYRACEQLMFEQNSDVLWVNFKSKIIPLLERMRSSYGLSDYKIIKQPSDKRSKLVAVIKVYPIFAVEEFEITVNLEDDDTVNVVEG